MEEQSYIELYNTYSETIKKNSHEILNCFRDAAFDKFKEAGFPSPDSEHYHYTDLSKAYKVNYGLNINRIPIKTASNELFHCDVPGIKSHLYYVVNDTFIRNEQKDILPDGVVICGISEAAQRYPELLKKHFAHLSEKSTDENVLFNMTFAQDGFFMYVPKNTEITEPVQLINIMTGNADIMANSHNIIILEDNAKAKLLVCDHTQNDRTYLSNRITEVSVGRNAAYEHYKLESTGNKHTNICNLLIEQQEGSKVLTNVITLQNGLTRNNINISLNGEHAETKLCGMAIGNNTQHIDNHTDIRHNVPNCTSNELFKYILDGQSKGIFSGRVMVKQNAQKTASYQTNKNMCLSADAKMYTKPQLEIYADDVKCSHGATTGQLDENAMFYLRSRGLSKSEARLLLLQAFTADVTENINVSALKERVKMLVESRLRNEQPKCMSCAMCK
ncbi:MAG: Fe-S cluster assembly protein SufD [Bacteroidales bacterium]|nr:Fe-S cluster assembly protein SufD [Bacteroidales bacterium]